MDYMIVKTTEGSSHGVDLEDIMQLVRKYNMHMYSAKCSFRVQVGNFLGYPLAKRGTEANLDKRHVFIDMRSPRNIKERQQLISYLTAQSHFQSCVGDNAFLYFPP